MLQQSWIMETSSAGAEQAFALDYNDYYFFDTQKQNENSTQQKKHRSFEQT